MLVQFRTVLSTGMPMQPLDRLLMVVDGLFAFRMNMGMRVLVESIYEAAALEGLYAVVQEDQPDMRDRTIRRRLDHAYEQNLCLRTGDGKRGNPHRYYLSEAGRAVVNKVKGMALLGQV